LSGRRERCRSLSHRRLRAEPRPVMQVNHLRSVRFHWMERTITWWVGQPCRLPPNGTKLDGLRRPQPALGPFWCSRFIHPASAFACPNASPSDRIEHARLVAVERPQVIFCGGLRPWHDSADRASREAATAWALTAQYTQVTRPDVGSLAMGPAVQQRHSQLSRLRTRGRNMEATLRHRPNTRRPH
jgi:hypothetical protein